MTVRCGCPDDENAQVDGGYRDSIVFGACNTCRPVEEVDLFGALIGAIDRAREARREDFTLAPERPYEQVLDESERGGH